MIGLVRCRRSGFAVRQVNGSRCSDHSSCAVWQWIDGTLGPTSAAAMRLASHVVAGHGAEVGLEMGEAEPARRADDLTPLVDLLHDRALTGPVRDRRPVYVDLLPPCNAGCPAGENIQAWLAHAQAGRHEQAWRQLVADNPMPAIHGRVCYHPCESVCNRASLDSAVSIHAVERFLGDACGSVLTVALK